jgi:hypothetical protein
VVFLLNPHPAHSAEWTFSCGSLSSNLVGFFMVAVPYGTARFSIGDRSLDPGATLSAEQRGLPAREAEA